MAEVRACHQGLVPMGGMTYVHGSEIISKILATDATDSEACNPRLGSLPAELSSLGEFLALTGWPGG